jgi:hypothetical protein
MADVDMAAMLREAVQAWQDSTADALLSRARLLAPKRTGEFAASLYVLSTQTSGTFVSQIFTDSTKPRLVWVTQGTQPHVILPVRGRALAWPASPANTSISVPGQANYIFATIVNHPGTQPNNFAAKAVEQLRQPAMDSLRATVADALSKGMVSIGRRRKL